MDFSKLERAFQPKCVAVVGDKAESNYMWLRAQSTFTGSLYSVQVDPNELEGIKALEVKNYPSLMDIPEPVDFVIVAVPKAIAPRILDDCIKKEVGAAHFFTSGFGETDTEEGVRLERMMVERAKEADFHLVGPNCMGIYSPSVGLRQSVRQPAGFEGSVGFISQSGTHAGTISEEAYHQGVEIDKMVSFGNGVVLDSTDYLEYFGQDPNIKAIGMYLEGVKEGNRFLNVLRDVVSKKPVVIWKGGRTEEGGRAIASHTGSLAVPMAVWDAAVRQCGAVKVDNQEELIDTLKAILALKPVYGDRVGIAGGSGGQSVAVADVFAEAGLNVPKLTQQSYDKLAEFFVLVGSGYRNPIDPGLNRKEMKRILEILEQDDHIDNIVFLTAATSLVRFPKERDSDLKTLIDIRERSSKPVAVILAFSAPDLAEEVSSYARQLKEGGIPLFIGLEQGARALRNTLVYHALQDAIKS